MSSHHGDRVLMAVRNTFFHQDIAGYGPLQSLFKETLRRLQVMVQVMDLFSVLTKETIIRLQVMDLFNILIKETIMRLHTGTDRDGHRDY